MSASTVMTADTNAVSDCRRDRTPKLEEGAVVGDPGPGEAIGGAGGPKIGLEAGAKGDKVGAVAGGE